MNEINSIKRFTYPKTESFWNALEITLQNYTLDSLDYFAIKRDKVLFSLCYSYGLRLSEVLSLQLNDMNFSKTEDNDGSYGSIFIENGNAPRLIYPVFSEVTEDIELYLNMRFHFLNATQNGKLFLTTKGNALTSHYINYRLQFYNLKLPSSKRISSLHTFRQYYITDLLRIRGISQSFINNQIGNNITNNQIYSHLLPTSNQNGVGV